VQNTGSQPIPGLKVLIKPGAHLAFDSTKPRIPLPGEEDVTRMESFFKKLVTVGLPLEPVGTNVLNPSNDSHYQRETAVFDTYACALPSGTRDRAVGFGGRIYLKDTVTPGEDLTFQGFIVKDSQEIPVGTVVVHVMYPEFVECPLCGGKGYREDFVGRETCPSCRGKGRITKH
jgi:hypothetical protein